MAVVREFVVHGCCHVKIYDDCLLPEEERPAVLRRLEKIVEQDIINREAKRRAMEKAQQEGGEKSDEKDGRIIAECRGALLAPSCVPER